MDHHYHCVDLLNIMLLMEQYGLGQQQQQQQQLNNEEFLMSKKSSSGVDV